jgi:two-component system aerobic respiration control sensor histidine kinase ArcB
MFNDVECNFPSSYLLDYSKELIIGIDSNGTVRLVNNSFVNFFNVGKQEILGENFNDLYKKFGLKKLFLPVNNSLDSELIDKFESKYYIDSHDFLVAWMMIAINTSNRQYVVFKGEDLTNSKIMQEKLDMLDNIIRYAPDMIYWKDKHSVHLGCNEQFAIAAGFTDRREVVGKTDRDFPWHSQADKYREDDIYVIASGEPRLNIEDFMPYDNGKQATVITNKVPLRDLNGDIIGVLGIATDITQQKKVEYALSLAKEDAEAANHAKIEFIANMSHDIRTPLTGVVGMSKILEEAIVDPKYKNYARWLGESGVQLLKMLNEVLDVLSADNMQEIDKELEVFNIKKMLNDIIELEQPSTQLKGLKLIVNFDKNIPAKLIGDYTKLHRILLNLLGNAIKFTQCGHVRIDVTLQKLHESKVVVRFAISDTGIGIPKKLQSKVFDRFFRITPSYKGVYPGSGIGLHIAQTYAHLLGSNIQLISEIGVGTNFYFDLDLEIADKHICIGKDENYLDEKLASDLSLLISKNVPKDAPLILLVEDNNIARLMLERLVNQFGYRCKSVTDGESAFELASKVNFDLIITDLGLPGISGIDLTKKIRELEQIQQKMPVPIIGLTAHADPKIKNNCVYAGMNDAYTKPISSAIFDNIRFKYVLAVESKNDNKDKIFASLGLDLPSTEQELFDLDKIAILDTQKALSTIGNNMALLRSILYSMLNDELPNDILEIKNQHALGDWSGVEKIAHRLKGGLVYCGADRLIFACQYLERYKKAGLSAMLEKLYQQLLVSAEETLCAIKDWLE